MKFLIIIPTHNEEQFITSNLESLSNQDFRDFECVIVNDGSTDDTKEKIDSFIDQNINSENFKLVNLEQSKHSPGAKVVQTFYTGLETSNLQNFDVICKFDADIIFPPNYLSELNKIYVNNPKSGMVSGLVYIKNNKDFSENIFDFKNENSQWKFENLSSKNHVRGPIKSYRKECFQDINGLKKVLGWDNIDVMLAKKNGWEVVTLKDIWVKHLRPTAFQYKNQKAEKLGEYFYNIGLNFPLMLVSSLKSSLKNKSILEFFTTVSSFLKQNRKRELTAEEIQYIRNLRWKQMFSRK